MPKFLSAKALEILPEERKALIAFAKAPALGRTVSVNGHAHYYSQSVVEDSELAKQEECGTAGCVAGFVFAHVTTVQGKRQLRGTRSPNRYIDVATWDEEHCPKVLSDLYCEGNHQSLDKARRVVTKLLQTGKVRW